MSKLLQIVGILFALCSAVTSSGDIYTGPFKSSRWVQVDSYLSSDYMIGFTIALKLQNEDKLHNLLMDVSTPGLSSYGKHLSIDEINEKFSPDHKIAEMILNHFQTKATNSVFQYNLHQDLLKVYATVAEIEEIFDTKLSYFEDSWDISTNKAIRAIKSLNNIPSNIGKHLSFISLNTPIHGNNGLSGQQLRKSLDLSSIAPQEAAEISQRRLSAQADTQLSVSSGNQEAIVYFPVVCGDGSDNIASPPCSNLNEQNIPEISIELHDEKNSIYDRTKTVDNSDVICYNSDGETCNGLINQTCTCAVTVGTIPMYRKYTMNITGTFSSLGTSSFYGQSYAFTLLDVCTPQFLYDLYNIPSDINVRHNATQAVAEFYSEFYSQSDLNTFFDLMGLPEQEISLDNVIGDNPNDQNNPGGEAQLDVEYLMAIAQDSETYFYSIAELNPYSPENEGFLTWLYLVGNETNPPEVHSLSYADVEAQIFNASNPGSSQYAERCDQEFIKMGLRGLTVVTGSGDDGIASPLIRTDISACDVSQPMWPASSPYVVGLGATMLTDEYLPACGQDYASLPTSLPIQCTNYGEVVCTSTGGAVITSGGGFSNHYNREDVASWQDNVVDKYLTLDDVTPPQNTGYFNPNGRAYPDLATYGSLYMVYLNGSMTRESGTSASTPVFASMITLWNDMRKAQGKSTLGFINPLLYQVYENTPEAYTDITVGSNPCGAGHSGADINCCDESFSAAAGWDAVTGLGSPDFLVFSNIMINEDAYFPATNAFTSLSSNENNNDDDDDDDDDDDLLPIIAISTSGVALLTVGYLLYDMKKSR